MTEASDRYHDYVNPLVERYASKAMRWIFSPQYKFQTWRRLWVALAEAEENHRLQRQDLVLICGFGAGLTWGTALMRW